MLSSCTIRMQRATPTWSNTKTNLHTTNKKRQLCVLRLTKSWDKCLLGKIEIVIHSSPLSIHILVEVITNQPLKRALSRSNLSLEVIPPSNCPISLEFTISFIYLLYIINVLMKFKYISLNAPSLSPSQKCLNSGTCCL